MERLKRMSVFAKVVELGSFTAAARQLQMSVSSISQTVAKLEDELQLSLIHILLVQHLNQSPYRLGHLRRSLPDPQLLLINICLLYTSRC